jgi:hypothetical protein
MEPAQDLPLLWNALDAALTEDHIWPITLEPHEVKKIEEHCNTYFDKNQIDFRPSQYAYSRGGTWNPNERGMRGEYAGLKFFTGNKCNVDDFINGRPYRTSDKGDVILEGQTKTLIFDYKLKTMSWRMSHLFSEEYGDTYMASMDAKFAKESHDYLDGFIFSLHNKDLNTVYLIGWILRDDFVKYAQLVPKGTVLPHTYVNDDADQLCIPYRRLQPMHTLLNCNHYPITKEINEIMKSDWKEHLEHGREWNVQKYVRALRGLPSADSWIPGGSRALESIPRIAWLQTE